MMTEYEVVAYTKTGIYAEYVYAESVDEAIEIAEPKLCKMAFGRITDIRACINLKE